MSDMTNLLVGLGRPQYFPREPASKTDIAALVARWPSLPTDYIDALADGCGDLAGDNGMISLFEPTDVLRFSDPNDQGVPMLADMMVVGVDAGDYWYFYDPDGKLGHGAWALYVVAKATRNRSSAMLAGATLLRLFERLLVGVSPIDEPEAP